MNKNYIFIVMAVVVVISIIGIVTIQESKYADPIIAEKLILKINGFNYDAERILEQCRRIDSQTEYKQALDNWVVLLDKVDLMDFEIGQKGNSELGIQDKTLRDKAFESMDKWLYLRSEINTCFDEIESR